MIEGSVRRSSALGTREEEEEGINNKDKMCNPQTAERKIGSLKRKLVKQEDLFGAKQGYVWVCTTVFTVDNNQSQWCREENRICYE